MAEEHQGDTDAFDDGDELTAAVVGPVSPYHTASGVAAVRALLSSVTGDQARQQVALDEFSAATTAHCANLDLTLGRSAVLLFAALLYAVSDPAWPATERLRAHANDVSQGMWRDLDAHPLGYNGIAHGSAGVAYASLMWSRACGAGPASEVRSLLDRLAGAGEPSARGSRWPLTPPGDDSGDEFWPGWCHGNAGYVFLWTLAHMSYGDDVFAELAERSAWLATGPTGVDNLCCGTAGQSYALLSHYRSSGSEHWRSRAAEIAIGAAAAGVPDEDTNPPLSLYKGRAGLALLAIELDAPERSAMPLFEFGPRAWKT